MTESTGVARPAIGGLWASAAAVAALGSWILCSALPGINWVLWTGAAAIGLIGFTRTHGPARRPVVLLVSAAIVIAGAASITASPPLWALICLSVIFFLATAMLLSAGLTLRSVTVRFFALAPLMAFMNATVQTMRRSGEATQQIRSSRARAWTRGLAITLPILIVFALLLAGADPVFASWRDALLRFIGGWEFVVRTVFFIALLVIVVGAYGYAFGGSGIPIAQEKTPNRWLGSTERLILLGGVAGLFWLFLAVQLGYLFGNLPRMPASGVTFAEYARRGFAELTVVASASALLIVISELFGKEEGRRGILRFLTLLVVAAVLLLLGSAFRRVWLYEEAYGFTTARLYAQFYMGAVAAGLFMLSLEVVGEFDPGRVFRRAVAAATILFIALVYWNHEAWIARQNLDRFATTGKLDVVYLTRELSLDAAPTIMGRFSSLPDSVRSDVTRALLDKYAQQGEPRERHWYEWNLASSRARKVLTAGSGAP